MLGHDAEVAAGRQDADAPVGADIGGDDGDGRDLQGAAFEDRAHRLGNRDLAGRTFVQAHAAALDDQDARHLVARGGLEQARELGAVDLADGAADELADLGGEVNLLAVDPGVADHDAIVERHRDAELGEVRAGEPFRRRQQLREGARVDEGCDALARGKFVEKSGAGHLSPLVRWS